MRRRVRWAGSVAAAALAAGLVGTAAPGQAGPMVFAGRTATAEIAGSTPQEAWAGKANGPGMCGFLPGCESATTGRRGWTFQVVANVPGAGTVTLPVQARVVEQAPPTSMRMTWSASDARLGSLAADVVLTLSRRGRATRVGVAVRSVRADGLMRSVVEPLLGEGLQPQLAAWAQYVGQQRAAAGIGVDVVVRPAGRTRRAQGAATQPPGQGGPAGRSRPRQRGLAVVTVGSASLAATAPTASGRVQVYASGRRLCSARMTASAASCRFVAPRRPVAVVALVTGTMSDGFAIWHSGRARWSR